MVDICSVWGFSPIGLCAKDTDDVVRRWSVGIVAVIGWAREPGGDGILFACWLSMMRQMMASSSLWIEYRCHFYHSVRYQAAGPAPLRQINHEYIPYCVLVQCFNYDMII